MAAAAIAAAQVSQQQGFGFLDELAGSDNSRDKLRIVSLVGKYGYTWKDFGKGKKREVVSNRMKRIAAREARIKVWDTPKAQLRFSSEPILADTEDLTAWAEGRNCTLGLEFQKLHRDKGFGVVSPELLHALETAVQLGECEASQATKRESRRRQLHRLCNDPDSSELANTISLVVLITICVSCLAILIESLPSMMHNNNTADIVFFVLETICVTIFTIEFMCRIVSTPQLWAFCTNAMNIIDLLAILPYYIAILAPGVEISWLTILRMLRMVRVLRFAQKNETVNCVMLTLAASLDIALFMLFMLTIVVIVFACFVYNVERGTDDETLGCHVRPGEDYCSPFISIPEAMWLIMVTIMMVGYGDIVPSTVPGKFFASFACVIGIMCMALPVSVLGANFSTEMANSKAKSAKRQLIENARAQGGQGVVSSCKRVLECFEEFNDVTALCLELGKHELQETCKSHADLWQTHLQRRMHELDGHQKQAMMRQAGVGNKPATTLEKYEVLQFTGQVISEVRKPGEQELFDLFTYSTKLQDNLSSKLSQVAAHVDKAAELCTQVAASNTYIETLANQPELQDEDSEATSFRSQQKSINQQWDHVWAKLHQAQTSCAQVAARYNAQVANRV